MYQPALRPEQVKALYYLKVRLKRPMTSILREAVNEYLALHGGFEEIVPEEERARRQVTQDTHDS